MRNWERPMAVVDAFVANEFVSACGDKGAIYKFKCDAPAGSLYLYWKNDGKIDGVHDPNDRSRYHLGSDYTPCGAENEASKTDDFYDGFVDYNHNRRQDDGEGVIVWRGRWHNNGHATTNLNMNSWETAKS